MSRDSETCVHELLEKLGNISDAPQRVVACFPDTTILG